MSIFVIFTPVFGGCFQLFFITKFLEGQKYCVPLIKNWGDMSPSETRSLSMIYS